MCLMLSVQISDEIINEINPCGLITLLADIDIKAF